MVLCLNGVPAGSRRIAWSLVYSQPLSGMTTGVSLRWSRTVSSALDLSRLAAGYVSAAVTVVALSKTMYSYDGPVMEEPSGFFATGSVIVRLSPPAGADGSQPFHARV